VRCGADDRQALERLCSYMTRLALANERLQTNAAGQVVLKLKTPWRDGTRHLVMSPLEFMQRPAALVPRPQLHLIRVHGILAHHDKLRAQVLPHGPALLTQADPHAECEAGCSHHGPVRLSWGKLRKRVFEIDMEQCLNCGGELKIIAAILEQPVRWQGGGSDAGPATRCRCCNRWARKSNILAVVFGNRNSRP